MRHLKDGARWELIDNKFENFAKDPKSIRLGECTDGMNPFWRYEHQSQHMAGDSMHI